MRQLACGLALLAILVLSACSDSSDSKPTTPFWDVEVFPTGDAVTDVANLQNAFASEVVKVTHDGVSEYFYSFSQPTDSGQVNKDGNSHTGNFEFMIDVAKVPEPSGLALGLAVVCGLAGVRRRGA